MKIAQIAPIAFMILGNLYCGGATIFQFQIKGDIDPRMSRHVSLAVKEATLKKADVIFIELDTYGGALKDADEIRQTLLNTQIPTWVWINKNAASAGALIALACDSIYMANGSSMGAATVVSGADGTQAPDKYQSYMRSIMRATAETNKRNPTLAEAMVDPDVVLDSTIKKSGKVLTLTSSEAIKYKMCNAQAQSLNEVLIINKQESATLLTYEPSVTEQIISLFLNPAVSSILILIMIGGIYFELQTPGVGFPLVAAMVAALLYFTPFYLNGLAENWEILIFFVGIILLALEIFVVPGFGVTGVAGIVCIFTSLILSMLNNDFFDFRFVPSSDIATSLLIVLVAFIITLVMLFFVGNKFLESKYIKSISLADSHIQPIKKETHWVGMQGVAHTVLRPSGKVKLESGIFDAFTKGEFIEKGTPIVVIEEINGSLKVESAS